MYKYRLRVYHETEVSTCTIYTPRATGQRCKLCGGRLIQSDIIPWATWLWQCIHGLATTALAIKGSCMYLATVQTIAAEWLGRIQCNDCKPTLFSVQLKHHPWYSEPQYYCHCVEKAGYKVAVSISTQRSQLAGFQLLFFQLLTKHPIAPPIIINIVRSAHYLCFSFIAGCIRKML